VAHEEIGKTGGNRHGAVCEMEDFASRRLVLIRGMVQWVLEKKEQWEETRGHLEGLKCPL
jgi:hypothetical protein